MGCRHPVPWSLIALCVAASCADDPGPDAEKPPGWHQYSQGDYAGAIERFRQNLDQDPEDTSTLFYLARSFTFLSRYDSARAHIERAIAIDPGDPRLHETLGIVHTGLFTSRAYTGKQADHAAAAISSFERAVALDSSRMGAHYNLGVVYGYLDSTRLARLAFAAALRADSTYAPAHKKLGHLHLRAGELEKAAASFRRAVAHAPEDAEAHFNLGLAYRNLGDLERAVTNMERATELNPVDHKMRLNLGNLYMRTGRREEGRRLLVTAGRQLGHLSELHAEIRPPSQGEAVLVGSARDHYHMGLSYVLEGKPREAMREFRRSIAIVPGRKDPHTGLGMLLLEAGIADEGVTHLERAVEIDGKDAIAWTRLGWGYRKLERLPDARAAFETASRLDTNLAEAALNLGHVLFRMGNVEESVDQYLRAIDLRPQDPDAHASLGAAQARLGRLEKAAAAYGRALELEPENDRLRRAFADVSRRLGTATGG